MTQELAKFDDLKAELTAFVEPSKAIRVVDFLSCDSAVRAAKQVKDLLSRVTDRRMELTRPLKEAAKLIEAYAKDLSLPLEDASAHIQRELTKFAIEQEKNKRIEMARIEELRKQKEQDLLAKQAEEAASHAEAEAMFGSDEPAPVTEGEVVAPVETIEQKHAVEIAVLNGEAKTQAWEAGQQQLKNVRKTLKIKSFDPALVPKEFLIITLNEKAALAAIRAGVKISGVETEEVLSVAIGQRTYVPNQALSGSRDGDGWRP